MTPTAQTGSLRTPRESRQPSDPRPSPRTPAPDRPTFRDMLGEVLPLVEFVPAYGPPVVFLFGPWLLLGLVVAGPLAWLFALVVVMIVAATVLVAVAAAVLAGPYLLVRGLRRHRARDASVRAPAGQVVGIRSRRVVA